MITIENIDVKNILNNIKTNNMIYKIDDNYHVIFMEPDSFKELGYNELGFLINKPMKWLYNADDETLRDATKANKIVRVYKRHGCKWRYSVTTALYIVNNTFYNSKVGPLCLNENTCK